MTNSRDTSPSYATPTRTRYRLGEPGTTSLHFSVEDLTDLGLEPNAPTVEIFGSTFTRLETI